MGLARLNTRLLMCQVDTLDVTALRDTVLVPALLKASSSNLEKENNLFEDLLGLLALTPDPSLDDDQAESRKAWSAALEAARKADIDRYDSAFTKRRASVQVMRKTTPAQLKDSMFCTAAEVTLADVALEE